MTDYLRGALAWLAKGAYQERPEIQEAIARAERELGDQAFTLLESEICVYYHMFVRRGRKVEDILHNCHEALFRSVQSNVALAHRSIYVTAAVIPKDYIPTFWRHAFCGEPIGGYQSMGHFECTTALCTTMRETASDAESDAHCHLQNAFLCRFISVGLCDARVNALKKESFGHDLNTFYECLKVLLLGLSKCVHCTEAFRYISNALYDFIAWNLRSDWIYDDLPSFCISLWRNLGDDTTRQKYFMLVYDALPSERRTGALTPVIRHMALTLLDRYETLCGNDYEFVQKGLEQLCNFVQENANIWIEIGNNATILFKVLFTYRFIEPVTRIFAEVVERPELRDRIDEIELDAMITEADGLGDDSLAARLSELRTEDRAQGGQMISYDILSDMLRNGFLGVYRANRDNLEILEHFARVWQQRSSEVLEDVEKISGQRSVTPPPPPVTRLEALQPTTIEVPEIDDDPLFFRSTRPKL